MMRAYNQGNVAVMRPAMPGSVPVAGQPVAEKNQRPVAEPQENGMTILGFWLGLGILYVLWDLVVLRTKIKDAVEPGNIRSNVYNLFVIGIAAVIFINGFKVLLVKAAAWEIPGVSWLAKRLVPLFQL